MGNQPYYDENDMDELYEISEEWKDLEWDDNPSDLEEFEYDDEDLEDEPEDAEESSSEKGGKYSEYYKWDEEKGTWVKQDRDDHFVEVIMLAEKRKRADRMTAEEQKEFATYVFDFMELNYGKLLKRIIHHNMHSFMDGHMGSKSYLMPQDYRATHEIVKDPRKHKLIFKTNNELELFFYGLQVIYEKMLKLYTPFRDGKKVRFSTFLENYIQHHIIEYYRSDNPDMEGDTAHIRNLIKQINVAKAKLEAKGENPNDIRLLSKITGIKEEKINEIFFKQKTSLNKMLENNTVTDEKGNTDYIFEVTSSDDSSSDDMPDVQPWELPENRQTDEEMYTEKEVTVINVIQDYMTQDEQMLFCMKYCYNPPFPLPFNREIILSVLPELRSDGAELHIFSGISEEEEKEIKREWRKTFEEYEYSKDEIEKEVKNAFEAYILDSAKKRVQSMEDDELQRCVIEACRPRVEAKTKETKTARDQVLCRYTGFMKKYVTITVDSAIKKFQHHIMNSNAVGIIKHKDDKKGSRKDIPLAEWTTQQDIASIMADLESSLGLQGILESVESSISKKEQA